MSDGETIWKPAVDVNLIVRGAQVLVGLLILAKAVASRRRID